MNNQQSTLNTDEELQIILDNKIDQLQLNDNQKDDEEEMKQKTQKMAKSMALLFMKYKTLLSLKRMNEDPVPQEIVPRLFLGSIGTSLQKDRILDQNITHIVNCIGKQKNTFPNDFKYLKLELDDSLDQKIIQNFEESFQFIDQAINSQQNVLVHWQYKQIFFITCIIHLYNKIYIQIIQQNLNNFILIASIKLQYLFQSSFAGKSRSCTIVCAYMMKKFGYKRDLALKMIKFKRPITQPNDNFMEQLNEYQNEINCNQDEILNIHSQMYNQMELQKNCQENH